ncbi:MAG: DUF3332 domain-containing protein [Bacteroidales bacterium]|nr:DUF3332 domain-containing protein [Bacteroidales bacterium]
MKKIKSFLLAAILLGTALTQQSCMGSFALTNSLYDWNKTSVSGKWGQELVFVALVIIPVYEVCLFVDGIVLNSIEFWTGNSPLGMAPGEIETKIVQHDNDIYKLTAEKNTITVEKIGGENTGETGQFLYDEATQTWAFVNAEAEYQLR